MTEAGEQPFTAVPCYLPHNGGSSRLAIPLWEATPTPPRARPLPSRHYIPMAFPPWEDTSYLSLASSTCSAVTPKRGPHRAQSDARTAHRREHDSNSNPWAIQEPSNTNSAPS